MDEIKKLYLTDEEELEPNEEEDKTLDDDTDQRVEDGEVCANCGAEFVEEQGAASVCKICWPKLDGDERIGLLEAKADTR